MARVSLCSPYRFRVQRRDTFFGIARHFHLDPDLLIAANPDYKNADDLHPDDDIVVPHMQSVRLKGTLGKTLKAAYAQDHTMPTDAPHPTLDELIRLVKTMNPKSLHGAKNIAVPDNLQDAATMFSDLPPLPPKPHKHHAKHHSH